MNRFRPSGMPLAAVFYLLIGLGIIAGLIPMSAIAQTDPDILIERLEAPFSGDLKQMKSRRFIRALVSLSRTNYFYDNNAQARGFEYELLTNYEKFLNRGVKDKTKHVKIVFILKPFDQLIPALKAGKGDLVAAGLTVTPARQKKAAFTRPYISDVSEVIVLNKNLTGVDGLSDLAGRMVYVRPGSSYVEHLKTLNRQLVKDGHKPIDVVEGDPHLGTEDILEMLNAGVISATVADHHIADAWTEILPNLEVRKDLAINTGGAIAWAVRKKSTQLKQSLDQFIQKNKKGSLLGNILFKRYYRNSKWINNPVTADERRKLERYINVFSDYSGRYGFDWLAVAAQAYQESGLDHGKKSPVGAIGIMQLLPSTAADKSVNIPNIKDVENNIHAGVKYLNFLRTRYFDDPEISPQARVDFSWAAYNAGPAKISRLRRKAAQRGFDPNRWFYHVEKIAAKEIGRETVDYVANINKYYVAYKLYFESNQQRRKEMEKLGVASQVKPAPKKTSKAVSKPAVKAKKSSKNKSPVYHTVRKGETLYRISQRYGVPVQALQKRNKLTGKTVIHPGDKLIIKP